MFITNKVNFLISLNFVLLCITEVKVHFIRWVDNDALINVLNEKFSVGKEFTGDYIWAIICLRKRNYSALTKIRPKYSIFSVNTKN